ncbi:MAG: DUF2513 domain-containing protein [Magnetococcales bacterium]|nr:DUF2513 domain-containing protein [Magnetococcales bacterium]
MLKDAGLIEAVCRDGFGRMECVASNLTWAGQEFLEEIRSEHSWNRILETIKKNGLEITFGAIKAAAGAILAKTFSGG